MFLRIWTETSFALIFVERVYCSLIPSCLSTRTRTPHLCYLVLLDKNFQKSGSASNFFFYNKVYFGA